MVQQKQEVATMTEIEELVQADIDHLWRPFTAASAKTTPNTLIVESKGAVIKDITGKEYIDGFAGLWTINVGHGRKEIQDAIKAQMEKLAYFSLFKFSNVPSIQLADKLSKLLPGDVNRVFITLGGSESVDTALKMARQYWQNLGRGSKYKFISRKMAYHGTAFGGTSVQGIASNRAKFEPLLPGVSHICAPSCYHCDYGLAPDSCKLECAWDLQREIELQGKDTVAAFIGESLIGTAGVYFPPDEYWKVIRQICDDNEVLLIVDEVISGFGRTGKMFYAEHTGVVPDLMTMAKGLSSGYLPLGAVGARESVYQAFTATGTDFASGCTYDGHPLCTAAGVANLDIIVNENLPERSRLMGEVLKEKFERLHSHKVVGDIRSRGLLCGIELVKDKKTKEPFPGSAWVNAAVANEAYKRGVFVRPLVGGVTIAFAPPLIISEEQIETVASVLDESLTAFEKTL